MEKGALIYDRFYIDESRGLSISIDLPSTLDVTIIPYNEEWKVISDLGWLTNSIITLPDNTKFFNFYFKKKDNTSFTLNDNELIKSFKFRYN